MLGSIDYVELSENEALDPTLSNNKGIVEIILDNEHQGRSQCGVSGVS